MKPIRRIIYTILIALSILCMFMPIATFEDNTIDAIQEEITKQEGNVKRAEDKLVREQKKADNEKGIAKQQEKVDKEKAELDELLAQKAELEGAESAAGLKYSLLPNKLPADIQVDMQIVNQNGGVYPTDYSAYYTSTWVALGLLVLALALVWAGGSRPVSKVYTFASFLNLIAVVVLLYVVLRLNAIPVKLPYSNPVMNWPVAIAMLLMPIIALLLHCTSVTNTKRTMIYVLCIALSILSLLPFWIMIVNATRNSQQIQGGMSLIPSTFLSNNWYILQSKGFDVMVGFKNSAIIAFGSTILSVYFSALTAYGLTVYRFKGAKFLYSVILAIIMIPGQVTGTGFFMFMYQLEWTNSYLPLVIPAIASASTVFFFKQYLEANFQISLVEAARIDGAGEFYTYNKIILPIMVPAMATMGIMAVIASWNNYLTPLMLLSKAEMKTLPMMVKELRGDIYRTEYGSIYLGLTLTAMPLLIVYFCFSKYIIAGVAVGGVKE